MLSGIGLAGGSVGAVVGIGGGNVMVPLMTLLSRTLTQHQITSTSLLAVVGTGTSAAATYLASGHVDPIAASLIVAAATVTAPLGAMSASKLSASQLRLCLAICLLGCAPLVPLKNSLEGEDAVAPVPWSISSVSVVLASGALAGLTSGLLGIGGGVVLTPALALTTDLAHHTVVGTSLTAMVIPSLVGAATHYRNGVIVLGAAWPLCLGSFVGGCVGGLFASRLPEKEMRWIFACVMGTIAAVMLRGAVRKL